MRAIEFLNSLGEVWAAAMTRSLVDASLLLAVVTVVWFPLRRRISSQMAYGLFLLVLLKAAFPVPLELPAAVARLVPGSPAERLIGASQGRPATVLPAREMPAAHQAGRPGSFRICLTFRTWLRSEAEVPTGRERRMRTWEAWKWSRTHQPPHRRRGKLPPLSRRMR